MSILVVIRERGEVAPLIIWGQRFARARNESLHVLYLKSGRKDEGLKRLPILPEDDEQSDPLIHEIRDAIEEMNHHITDQREHDGSEPHKSHLPGLWYAAGDGALRICLQQVDELDVSLLLLGKADLQKNDDGNDVTNALLRDAHCDVMVLRPGSKDAKEAKHIVVPLAGGPHALVALQLAAAVAEQLKQPVTALNIQNENQSDAQEVGQLHLQHLIKKSGLQNSDHVETKVLVNSNIRNALNDTATDDCDLLILGTSDHGVVTKMLFGTVDAHLMSHHQGTGVAVIRRARPLHSRIRMAIERFAAGRIPQLDREERIELSERLYEGSRCTFDYVALMVLATTIAALGLIQNSTAVVVGAMLVAPLMTPIIGAGLGLVQGNSMLVRLSGKSICIGFVVAIFTGFIIGFCAPGVALTDELMGRGAPNALDLGIAFASGLAAAYALARPNLSAALPGVAIAAALVPPIATVGISLAIGAFANARGAVLLFGTNVVAIIIGAALVLHLVGIRSARPQAGRVWASRVVLMLLLLTAILAVPLSSVYLAQITAREAQSLESIVNNTIAGERSCILYKIDIDQDQEIPQIRIVLINAEEIGVDLRDQLRQRIEERLEQEVQLEILRIRADLIH